MHARARTHAPSPPPLLQRMRDADAGVLSVLRGRTGGGDDARDRRATVAETEKKVAQVR